MHHRDSFEIRTEGRGTIDITDRVDAAVRASGIDEGLCTVFVHHTSASVIVCENADPAVRQDLDAFLDRLVPDADPLYRHTAEGPDDMPSHVRSVLTATSIGIPVTGGRCELGTWQGVFLYEHRHRGHRRQITVTTVG